MNTYVLLHFEHKNDVTIIIRLRVVAPYKSLTMTVTSFLCSKRNTTWVVME